MIVNQNPVAHNVTVIKDNHSAFASNGYLSPRPTKENDGFYIGINGLLIRITYSQKPSEEIATNELQSNQISIDKIVYLSSFTDRAGNITLRYQVRRAMPIDEADPTPAAHKDSALDNEPLSIEEARDLERLTSHLLNVTMAPDMEAEILKRKSHETAFAELKTIVANPCKLVGGTDFERHKALEDTHNTMKSMYGTLDALELADGGDVAAGEKINLKRDLREMIGEFLASLGPTHPWPPELKEVVRSLMRDLGDKIDGTLTPPATQPDALSPPIENYKQRWKKVLTLASNFMRPDDAEGGALGFGPSKKIKQRPTSLLERQDTEKGELNTVYLMASMDKLTTKLPSVRSIIDSGETAISDGTKLDAGSRRVLKDIGEELSDFIVRWTKPNQKDRLAAEQISSEALKEKLIYFSEAKEIIDIWFSNNPWKETPPSNTPEMSPRPAPEFGSPYSKFGTVIYQSNFLAPKRSSDRVVEPHEKTDLPE